MYQITRGYKQGRAVLYYDVVDPVENKTTEIVTGFLKNNAYNYTDLKNQIILELHPFINQLTGRRPIVLPVIMEVRKSSEE